MNNNTSSQYWFTIEPYVYVSVGKNAALLYNTLDGNTIPVKQQKIRKLIGDLYRKDNCGVILLTGNHIDDKDMQSFIIDLRNKFMGDIIDTSLSSGKPVQLMPKLNLQTDIKRLKQDEFRSTGEHIMQYLQETTVHFDNKINADTYCKFLSQIPRWNKLRLVNLWDYEQRNTLMNFLILSSVMTVIITPYDKITVQNLSLINIDIFKLHIIIDFPADMQQLHEAWTVLSGQKCPAQFVFKIASDKDYEQSEIIIDQYNIKDYKLEPVYTGNNLSFFEKNIFLTEEDILSEPLSMREIFARQALNTFDFGKIHVMSNGDVHANLNQPVLGNINTHNIQEIVYKEMNEGKSWLRIRDQKPCTDCIYQYLCPSPSNYEIAIGKPNLCHVVENK
ncbi:MAG: TIGR04150 pseudo-rSAM protein [Bacteroidales bacterium]|jgi:pseudo-rSAM protein|nr:TIGR04150 pseudo-rSAM protein [Bacteroidales bacterium]